MGGNYYFIDVEPALIFVIQISFALFTFSPVGTFFMRIIYDYQKIMTKQDITD